MFIWHLKLQRFPRQPFFGSWNFTFRVERLAGIPHDQGEVVENVLGGVVRVNLNKIFENKKKLVFAFSSIVI